MAPPFRFKGSCVIDTVIIPPSGIAPKAHGAQAKPDRDAFALCVLEVAARRAGVAGIDALALRVLVARGGAVKRAYLVRELVLGGPACSRLLNRLEAVDFAVRLCGSDRRTLEIELLDDGWDAAERVSVEFSGCARDVARTWGELLVRDASDDGRPIVFGGAAVDGAAVCGADVFRDDVTLDDALAANQALAQLCEGQQLTRTQALCLMVVRASGMNAFAPRAATTIAQLASFSRTTVRSALWTLRKRGLL